MRSIKALAAGITLLMLFLAGCAAGEPLSIEKIEKPVGKAADFVQHCQGDNGFHLLQDSDATYYLFLNGIKASPGEEAIIFSDVVLAIEGDVLQMLISSHRIDMDYAVAGGSTALYKLRIPKMIDTIRIYNNGEEDIFQSIHR